LQPFDKCQLKNGEYHQQEEARGSGELQETAKRDEEKTSSNVDEILHFTAVP
jgi:hypothetical protein